MHIHILGICGTFMAGLALLARAQGHQVSGCDAQVYPPMSTQLAEAGIEVLQGYDPAHLQPAPDQVVVGNAMTRGNPAVEYLLDSGLPYTSGPQWLAEHILPGRWVLAVAGTHGKTTVSAMLAHILEQAGLQPGFLIGGLPQNFGLSARLGTGQAFVVEADEYDSAFFDKRAKFIHYRPQTLVLNNLEFDHADIYPDLAAIQRQFHHLIRTVPRSALIISNGTDPQLEHTLDIGCWTPIQRFVSGDWTTTDAYADGSAFDVCQQQQPVGRVEWEQLGQHNIANALAAIAAAHHAGVAVDQAVAALNTFSGVRRRLEQRGTVGGIRVYDDFAHHPTAIATTLQGLRARVGTERIIAVLEPRSNTMRRGVFTAQLTPALQAADRVLLYQPPELAGLLEPVATAVGGQCFCHIDDLLTYLIAELRRNDHVLIMSNGGFEAIHERLLQALAQAH